MFANRPGRSAGFLPAALICVAPLLLAPGAAGLDSEAAAGPDETLPAGVAAVGPGVEVRFEALDELLLRRHGMSTEGRALLDLLLKKRVLEALAEEEGLVVSDDDVSRRWSELDRMARSAGQTEGLLPEVERRGFTVPEFRELLRTALVQERLAKKALGLSADAAVGGEQQEIWLQQVLAERGLERPLPPWAGGFVARCGETRVTTDEFATFLRKRLPTDPVREAAAHLLLVAAIEKRLPELSAEERARGVEAEIARRRAKHRLSVPGMTFEQRLGASGRSLDQLRTDPAVQVAALTRLWVDHNHGPDGLRSAYEAERGLFEGLHGHAVKSHILFLVAGRFRNELNQRTFEEAQARLEELADRCGDVEDFRNLVSAFSEDSHTREAKGELGWVPREREDVPAPLRAAIFEYLDAGGEIPTGGRAIGPVRLDSGVALLWISAERESPGWEIMGEHVHEELRRRFVERVLPGESVKLWR